MYLCIYSLICVHMKILKVNASSDSVSSGNPDVHYGIRRLLGKAKLFSHVAFFMVGVGKPELI